MIKHKETRESFQTLKNKRIYADWGDTLYDFNHKAFDDIEQYITEQEKKDTLLDLYRLYNEFLERYYTQDRLLDRQRDLDMLREIREEIYALEEELKWHN